MKRNEDFRNALGEPDEYFQQSVMDTLNQLNRQAERESRPKWNFSMRLVSSFAALVLVIGGIVIAARNDHRDYLTPAPTSPVDITATAQSTVTPLASPAVIETEHAVLSFTEAVRDGSEVRITVDIRPKNERTLALNASHLLGTYVRYVTDLYGIQPDSPDQSLYDWIVDHGFREALAVDLNSQRNDEPGPFLGSWKIEKHTLREDGSSVMTIAGPAAEGNIYDLEYHIVPWNMEDKEGSFLPHQHNGGLIRLTLTDTASHIPEIKVLPQENPTPIPPEDEYSKQAWNLANAAVYSDLVNNPDARFYQPYYIKGIVQKVFPGIPGRVLINTSEDGSSQPVIVESPSYRTFPWKAGSSYRIYADVSYIEDNIPVLTARYCHSYPPESKQEYVDFDQAAVTIREAVTDGIAVYLSVEVRPKEKDCLIVGSNISPSASTAQDAWITPDYNGQTVYQWAFEHDYHQIMSFEISLLPDTLLGSFITTETKITEDGSTIISFVSGLVSDTDQHPLRLSLIPYDMDSFVDDDTKRYRLMIEKRYDKDISFSSRATDETPEILADYISIADPDTGKSGGEIEASIFRTSLGLYCKLNRPVLDGIPTRMCFFEGFPAPFLLMNAPDPQFSVTETTLFTPAGSQPEDYPDSLGFRLITLDLYGSNSSQTEYTLKKLGEARPLLPAEEAIDAFTDPNHTVTP